MMKTTKDLEEMCEESFNKLNKLDDLRHLVFLIEWFGGVDGLIHAVHEHIIQPDFESANEGGDKDRYEELVKVLTHRVNKYY